MALMVPQSLASVLTPAFAAPTVSDTIAYTPGLQLHVIVGGTATTITVVVPGVEPYSGGPRDDLVAAAVTNATRYFAIEEEAVDPATGLVTVTYSQITAVTAALIRRT